MSVKKIVALGLAVALPGWFAVPGLLSAAEKKAVGAGSEVKTSAYKVDAGASTIKWVGKKVTGQHNGTIAIKEGDVRVAGDAVVGGNFVIDTTSITDLDLDPESKAKLEGHLKSNDFFAVEQYPTANFEITGVQPMASGENTHKVTGNLTIKGKTNALSFPAKISVTPEAVTAEATGVAVDRTLFDIRYGSGKFFKGLGDKVINDEFWLDIKLVAKK